jgi:hypothetical protein
MKSGSSTIENRRERISNATNVGSSAATGFRTANALHYRPHYSCRGSVSPRIEGSLKSPRSRYDRAFFAGCAWIVGRVRALLRWLIRLIAGSIGWISVKPLTLGLWMTTGLWLGLSCLVKAHATLGSRLLTQAHTVYHGFVPGLKAFGIRALACFRCAPLVLLPGARTSVLKLDVGSSGRSQRFLGEGAEREACPRSSGRASLICVTCNRQPSSAWGAEHDQLQARIHALDWCYAQRASTGGRGHGAEWAKVRRLALNARRLLEVQESRVLGQAASREDQTHSSKPNRLNDAAYIDPLWAGHAI